MKLSDFNEVARLVPEKKKIIYCNGGTEHQQKVGHNKCLDQLTPLLEMEVTLDVGKLVGIITQTITKYEGHVDWQKRCSPLQLANAIASSNVIEIKRPQ